MAYRFILEVPEYLVGDANIVLTHSGDAEAHFARDSHGLGFEDPYKNLSVAAHSLRVINALYNWYDDMGGSDAASRVNIRVVLHSGERLSFHDTPREAMIAAIRRDQPWVERTIPKIGEHDTRVDPGTAVIEADTVAAVPAEAGPTVSTSVIEQEDIGPWVNPVTILATDENRAGEGITVAGVPQVHIGVTELSKPMRVYGELFGLEVIGRGNRTETGGWEFLPPEYHDEQDAQWGTQPEFAFMQNGPLSIAIERLGRGMPLDVYREVPDPIHIVVDPASHRHIRSMVLMRSYNVLDVRSDGLVFRDPFGYTWAVLEYEEGN